MPAYFGSPPGRKCNCGNDAIAVQCPSVFQPTPVLLCDSCLQADGIDREVRSVAYPGAIPPNAYETGYAIGEQARREVDEQILNALWDPDGAK